MHLIDKEVRKDLPAKKAGLGAAIKNKIKGIKDAVNRGHQNYKNRKDDTNKYRSVIYWKDNQN